MPLTLQKTEVSDVLVTVAEKVSVLPRRTVPELGAMVTVICGGGGVVEPPPELLAQAAREKTNATRKIEQSVWLGRRRRRVAGPCFGSVCERGRMENGNADEGPAKRRGGVEAVTERLAKICLL